MWRSPGHFLRTARYHEQAQEQEQIFIYKDDFGFDIHL